MSGEIPKDEGLDKTLSVLKEGYEFILNRKEDLNTDVFETRILGEKTICLTGSEGAELFYDNDRFRRSDAAPRRVEKTLFGEGGVQGLDGAEHHHRKAMFMTLMDDDSMMEIDRLMRKYWRRYFEAAGSLETIELYEAAKIVILRTACEWTGVPLREEEIEERARQISDLFESPAALGVQHWKGRISRSKANEWMEEVIEDVRKEKISVDEDRAVFAFSRARDEKGELLDKKTAAVEMLNLIRPMTAVSVWVAMIGLAMHEFPREKEKLKRTEHYKIEWFIQEVRRYYPFFPFAVARTDADFKWKGYEFKEGTLTLLDLYGTNRHPADWIRPEEFMPERFRGWQQTPFNFIPQGGGSYDFGHRCAGEFITIVMMKATVDFLVNEMDYDVPEQDFGFEFNDIPAVPNDKVKINNYRFQ
ncbi:cytochrome P450 [Salinicoccus halodurans]|uniref:Cytochrome P450 n=1 Tax=Salinicoccus halodurans TaxID=407035 RepID=A0A0F7HMX1_9STAP|nr:cytochrome P450 [Salinicoccus halodurans]AKG74868.1 cytochrome P450 [Salinicoccus halodurans]SFK69204.1 fatty-acid peroxygenase [Salinicoccus halodurans]